MTHVIEGSEKPTLGPIINQSCAASIKIKATCLKRTFRKPMARNQANDTGQLSGLSGLSQRDGSLPPNIIPNSNEDPRTAHPFNDHPPALAKVETQREKKMR
jgi:hypothetical protein